MKVAVMQPYFFPYIGYIQLLHAVDTFVFLDDVNYINKGWINRNQLILNGQTALFSIPLKEASQNKLISEIFLSNDEKWRSKFFKSLEMNYRKASYFDQGMELITRTFNSGIDKIAELIFFTFELIISELNLKVTLKTSSKLDAGSDYKGQNRILEICKKEKAAIYINPAGGRELYDPQFFKESNIELKFIKPLLINYPQTVPGFIPGLSFLDVCMNNSYDDIKNILIRYEIEN